MNPTVRLCVVDTVGRLALDDVATRNARVAPRCAAVDGRHRVFPGALLSIHQMLSVFGEQDRRRVRELVDGHLTDQIDYRLVDYHQATSSYLELTDAVYALDPEGPQQEGVYKELVALCIAKSADRAAHRGGYRAGAVRH